MGFWRRSALDLVHIAVARTEVQKPLGKSPCCSAKPLKALVQRLVACRSAGSRIYLSICAYIDIQTYPGPLWAPSCTVIQSRSKPSPLFSRRSTHQSPGFAPTGWIMKCSETHCIPHVSSREWSSRSRLVSIPAGNVHVKVSFQENHLGCSVN